MSVAASILMAQNRAMRRFTEAGATTLERAVGLKDLGLRPRWAIRILINHGVLVPVGDERYYIDLAAAERFRARRDRRMLIFLGVCVLILILFLLLH